jgi:hypothetical protein
LARSLTGYDGQIESESDVRENRRSGDFKALGEKMTRNVTSRQDRAVTDFGMPVEPKKIALAEWTRQARAPILITPT